jgi:predicted dehydrogenase
VINLTVPQAHGEIALAALESGKSVYNEKPLAISRDDARRMLDLARSKRLLVGCAPDTFLGAGLQTCRKLIDDGVIGEPVAALAVMQTHGPETWHPNPDFFYQPGAGPLFDMGPYYLTALIALLGSVRRVAGSARISFRERLITSQPHAGTYITVNTPTHISAVLDFAAGPVGTLVTSFDVHHSERFRLEIYGADGTLVLPDPNTFGGPVRVFSGRGAEWREQELTHQHTENSRSIGVLDMARALRTGESYRASGELAYHVLDIMHAIHESSAEGRHVELASSVDRPSALPIGWSALESSLGA